MSNFWPLLHAFALKCPETTNLILFTKLFGLCDLEIWQMTLKTWEPQGVGVSNNVVKYYYNRWGNVLTKAWRVRWTPQIWPVSLSFLACVTLKFHRWTKKTWKPQVVCVSYNVVKYHDNRWRIMLTKAGTDGQTYKFDPFHQVKNASKLGK